MKTLNYLLLALILIFVPVLAHGQFTVPTTQGNFSWTGVDVWIPGNLQLLSPIPPCTSGQYVQGLDTTFAPICGTPNVEGPALYFPPTLAGAISAAGTAGAVVVPGNYAGTDTFNANPNGVQVFEQRPLGSPYAAVKIINAAQYGALCNGSHDDTTAIQNTINAAYGYNIDVVTKEATVVELPAGTCVISKTLTFGWYGAMFGQGSATILFANYSGCPSSCSSWAGNYDVIDVKVSGTAPSGPAVSGRHFHDFRIRGAGNAVSGIGIHVLNTSNTYGPSNYAIPGLFFDHLNISYLDTAILAEDMVNSSIDHNVINGVRGGVIFEGDVVNTQVQANSIGFSTDSYSATGGSSIGFETEPNTKYGGGYEAPQGIYFTHNSVVAFDYDVEDTQSAATYITDNVLDYSSDGPTSSGAGIAIGVDGVGAGTWIERNYIAVNTATGYGIYSQSAGGSEGLWIRDNYILGYATPGTSLGIALAGSGTAYQEHIVGNIFYNLQDGIYVLQSLVDSEIRSNSASALTLHLIDLSGASSLVHTGTVVDGNTTTDSIATINEGTASGYVLGYNRSPSQLTGTFTASGSGCTFSAGTAGQACTATITNQFAFPDTSYIVTGCAVVNSSTHNYVSTVAAPTLGNQFTVAETATDTSSTGGGTIYCSVVHE